MVFGSFVSIEWLGRVGKVGKIIDGNMDLGVTRFDTIGIRQKHTSIESIIHMSSRLWVIIILEHLKGSLRSVFRG